MCASVYVAACAVPHTIYEEYQSSVWRHALNTMAISLSQGNFALLFCSSFHCCGIHANNEHGQNPPPPTHSINPSLASSNAFFPLGSLPIPFQCFKVKYAGLKIFFHFIQTTAKILFLDQEWSVFFIFFALVSEISGKLWLDIQSLRTGNACNILLKSLMPFSLNQESINAFICKPHLDMPLQICLVRFNSFFILFTLQLTWNSINELYNLWHILSDAICIYKLVIRAALQYCLFREFKWPWWQPLSLQA